MKKQELVRMLLDIYGTFELSPKQVAKIMNVSEQTLWRMRSRSIGPTYRQIGEAKNSTISYPLLPASNMWGMNYEK